MTLVDKSPKTAVWLATKHRITRGIGGALPGRVCCQLFKSYRLELQQGHLWTLLMPRQSGARLRLKGGARGAGVRCARPIRLQIGKAGVLSDSQKILGIWNLYV